MLKLVIFLCMVAFVRCERISLHKHSGFSGTNVDLEFTGCIATLDEDLDQNIESINTHNQCVQLYKEQFCSGEYLIIRPGTPSHSELSYYGFANNVRSIGPCFEKCHPDRVEGNRSSLESASIAFYGASRPSEEERPQAQFTVEAAQCRDITREIKSWSHPTFRTKLSTANCIELHEFGDCTGKSIQLTVGKATTAKTISMWLDKKQAGSLSFCGYNCNHSYTMEELDKEDIEPEDGSITLFRHIDFAGERTGLILRGCTPLPQGWNGNETSLTTSPPRSIISYGQCILLYGDEGCESPLMEMVMGAEPYIFWSDKSLKAIKACPSQHLEQFYCGSDTGGVVVLILLLIVCVVVIGVEALMIYRMRNEGAGRSNGISRFIGGRGHYQLENSNGMERQRDFEPERDQLGAGNSTTGSNTRLPYDHKMETPLIQINE